MTIVNGENAEALATNLLSVVETILNTSNEELASLLINDDGVVRDDIAASLTGKHKVHLDSLVEKYKGKFNEGYQKSQKETLSKLENQFNTLHNYEGNESLIDRFNNVLTRDKEEAISGIQTQEINEVNVKNSAWHKDLQSAHDKLISDHEIEKSQLIKDHQNHQIQSVVEGLLVTEVETLNPVFHTDPAKAANQKRTLVAMLKSMNWGVENNNLVLLDDNGNPAVNGQHHSLKPGEEITKVVLSQYDLTAAGSNIAPVKGGGSQQGTTTSIEGLDNQNDFHKAYKEATQAVNNARKISDPEKQKEAVIAAQVYVDKLRRHGIELHFLRK